MPKKHLLFVDDEANVLQGLRRMLRSMRDHWEIDTALSGQEALQKLSHQPCDVIVSDMRMPGMDGAELLSEVMKTHPQIVRIVLSGQSDQDSVLRAIGSTHQYLAKPCDMETLKSTVERACALHQILEDETLRQLVSRLKSIPSMPELYTEIMAEIRSDEPNIEKIGRTIGRDAAMTAKMLQIVNSAFFGFYHDIQDPRRAVTILGLDKVRSLVLTIHVFSEFNQAHLKQFNIGKLWKHNLYVAECAKILAAQQDHDKSFVDECYMAGLMHDLGKLILMANLPDAYHQVSALVNEQSILFYQAEHKVIGASHAEVGAYLLGLWGLPANIIEAITYHHQPQSCPGLVVSPLTYVHAANALVSTLTSATAMTSDLINKDYLNQLGLGDQIDTWTELCSELIRKDSPDE